MAYFAQVEVLYRLWDRPMPVIWPRNSFTLIEPEVSAELDRMGMDVQDCFRGRQALMERALRGSTFSEAAFSLEELRERLDRGLTGVRADMQTVDPTLATAMETARRKFFIMSST